MVILLSADRKSSDLQIVLISSATFVFQFRLSFIYTTLSQLGDIREERQLNSFSEVVFVLQILPTYQDKYVCEWFYNLVIT